MTFATDIYKNVLWGDTDARVTSVLKLVIWFAAFSFIASTILVYGAEMEIPGLSAGIGLIAAVIAGFLKFKH